MSTRAENGHPGRVLVVTNDFPTRVGGIETFVLALCQGLPPQDVVVYTASMPGDQEHDRSLAFPVYRDPSRVLLPTPALARRIGVVFRRHACDRVVFGASVPLGLLAPSLRRQGARRIVALTHGHEVWWARVPGTRRVLRRVGGSVDVLTYVSEWCRAAIAPALSSGARSQMVRLSPGVDPTRFHPDSGGVRVRRGLGIPEDAPVVVCLGRLVRRKGQDTLVKAWPDVLRARPDARLLLVGEGPDRGRLERMIDARGLRDSVTMVGGVTAADLPSHLDAGDVFAMPCRTRRLGLEVEAWGIVFLEALACGLPVVVGDSGGAPETIEALGDRGVVAATVTSVAAALVRLIEEHAGTARQDRSAPTPWTSEGATRELARLLTLPASRRAGS